MLSLFVTGLGTMTPSPADGCVIPVPIPAQDLIVQVTFAQLSQFGWNGNTPAEILYAGPAPLEVEGLAQINLRVPSGTGSPVTVQINVLSPDGTQTFSSPGALLWIQH